MEGWEFDVQPAKLQAAKTLKIVAKESLFSSFLKYCYRQLNTILLLILQSVEYSNKQLVTWPL